MNITGTCKDIYKGINGDLVKGMLERDIEKIRDALYAGADPNTMLSSRCNVLSWACSFISQEESTEAIRLLLEHGADIKESEKDPNNLPLNIAVSKNNAEAVRCIRWQGQWKLLQTLRSCDHGRSVYCFRSAGIAYGVI